MIDNHDLCHEFLGTLDRRGAEATAWLRNRGVPETVIHRDPGPIGIARIRPLGGLFNFTSDGPAAYIHPIWSREPWCGDLVDLVAWRAAEPGKWWRRTGAGVFLGEHQVDRAAYYEIPLRLHRTPLSWLIAARRDGTADGGACVLDWTLARSALLEVPRLVTDDLGHGEEVEAAMTLRRAPAPKIEVNARGRAGV